MSGCSGHWLLSVLPAALAFAAGLRLVWTELYPAAGAARRALAASRAWGGGSLMAGARRRWRARLALLYGAGALVSAGWAALLLATVSETARAVLLGALR